MTAAIYNQDHTNHVTFNTPGGLDDYSTNVAQMQSTADPGEVGTESLPTDGAGEFQRLRQIIKEISGKTHWYESPATSVFPGQNSKSANYTTVLIDAGKVIVHPSSDNNARTFTIDSNANVPYALGTEITFANQINGLTIAITADTLTLAGTTLTGPQVLGPNGTATARKIGTTSWLLTATGLLFPVDAADFDGSNDYMTRGAGLTGATDTKTGILSFWVRLDGGDGVLNAIFYSNSSRMRAFRDATNKFQIVGQTSGGATTLDMATVGTYTASATWRHILASWDLATAGASHLYISDIADKTVATFNNNEVDQTDTDWFTGSQTAGGLKLNGALAELYFAPGQYLDFSVRANRARFISELGKPAYLGTTGSIPTGQAPLVYFHLNDGEAVANFATNQGTGGNFSITGSLDTASTSPSD